MLMYTEICISDGGCQCDSDGLEELYIASSIIHQNCITACVSACMHANILLVCP